MAFFDRHEHTIRLSYHQTRDLWRRGFGDEGLGVIGTAGARGDWVLAEEASGHRRDEVECGVGRHGLLFFSAL